MSLLGNILKSYRRPRAVIAEFMDGGAREDRALGFLAGGCVITFIAQWPPLARQAYIEGQELDMLMGAALYGWIFLAPLLFYILAGLVQFIGYLLGFLGPSAMKTFVEVIWLASFIWFVVAGLRFKGNQTG